jgi:hypothetical protein
MQIASVLSYASMLQSIPVPGVKHLGDFGMGTVEKFVGLVIKAVEAKNPGAFNRLFELMHYDAEAARHAEQSPKEAPLTRERFLAVAMADNPNGLAKAISEACDDQTITSMVSTMKDQVANYIPFMGQGMNLDAIKNALSGAFPGAAPAGQDAAVKTASAQGGILAKITSFWKQLPKGARWGAGGLGGVLALRAIWGPVKKLAMLIIGGLIVKFLWGKVFGRGKSAQAKQQQATVHNIADTRAAKKHKKGWFSKMPEGLKKMAANALNEETGGAFSALGLDKKMGMNAAPAHA